jgi:hypothetical protein
LIGYLSDASSWAALNHLQYCVVLQIDRLNGEDGDTEFLGSLLHHSKWGNGVNKLQSIRKWIFLINYFTCPLA